MINKSNYTHLYKYISEFLEKTKKKAFFLQNL